MKSEKSQTRGDRLNKLEKELNDKSALLESRSKRVEELSCCSRPRTSGRGLACQAQKPCLAFKARDSTWNSAMARCT